jgi:hypothetical protein
MNWKKDHRYKGGMPLTLRLRVPSIILLNATLLMQKFIFEKLSNKFGNEDPKLAWLVGWLHDVSIG